MEQYETSEQNRKVYIIFPEGTNYYNSDLQEIYIGYPGLYCVKNIKDLFNEINIPYDNIQNWRDYSNSYDPTNANIKSDHERGIERVIITFPVSVRVTLEKREDKKVNAIFLIRELKVNKSYDLI